MDSDDISDKPDSAGAHSMRSQLIVVSPRPEVDQERESSAGSEPDHFIFSNPSASAMDNNDQITVTVEMTNLELEHQPVPTVEEVQLQQPPAASQLPITETPVRPSTVPALQMQHDKPSGNARSNSARTNGTKTRKGNGYQTLEDEHAMSPISPIHEQVLEEVLYNRPTLRLGREVSMRFRAQTAIPSRRRRVYRSLPHGAKRPKTTDALSTGDGRPRRRLSSLPNMNDEEISAITLEDIENIMNDDVIESPSTLQRQEDLRKSNRRLKERIQMHHQQEEVRTQVAQANFFADFYYVKWPKIKSRLRVALSYRLWNGHMKEVEGHFGTAVVSYFVYLRWLFIMNMVIFALWFGLVIVPNSIYLAVESPAHSASLLSCAYPFSDNSFISCSDDNTTSDNDAIFYLLTASPTYTCTALSNATLFSLQTCETIEGFINGTQQNIAHRESSVTVTVSNMMPDLSTDCTFGSGDSVNVTIQTVRICSNSIAPFIPWYQYVIDFFLGQGIFNETVLFYGRYSNATIGDYNLPVTYLFMTAVVYGISIVLLVYKMGQAYNESYVDVGKSKSINFCNKLFTAWDFNITDPDTAKLRRAQIKTDFEEEIADFDRRNTKRTWKELSIVISIRTATNLFTFIILVAGAAMIYYSTEFGLRNQSSSGISFEGLVTPVVITTLNLILPFFFSFLARFERFKTQSGEIKMTLVRTILVRLASLIVLMATIFILIQCTQTVMEDNSSSSTVTTCSFTSNLISDNLNNLNITSSQDCPICWETFIGQEFYKLGLTNLAVSVTSTLAVETFRNIASRLKYRGLGEKIGKGNFNIPKSILDLIYTQSLLWLGFFFSPILPAVILITSFLLFYIKKYSLIYNLEPDKRGATKTVRNNFLYLFLMLATLGVFLIPVGVVLASFRPSETCGPFRGSDSFFAVVSVWIDTFSCVTQQALDYFATASFVVPVIAVLFLIVYAQYVLLRSRKAKFELIKKQLILEGANVTHIVGKLDNVLQKVADHRQEVMMSAMVVSPTRNGSEQGDPSQTVTMRQRSSLDVSSEAMAVTPLRERIQIMRLSVASATEQNNFNSLSRERRPKRSSASSTVESSGEHHSFPSPVEEGTNKETTSM